VNVSGSTAMTDTNFRNAQSVSLQNLQANTTYYYLIYTTDQTGNVSVTWPATFQTTN
jgi:phosphodiesterase/alkaline phosphatase D-like protein